jgi:hypothetical protein
MEKVEYKSEKIGAKLGVNVIITKWLFLWFTYKFILWA